MICISKSQIKTLSINNAFIDTRCWWPVARKEINKYAGNVKCFAWLERSEVPSRDGNSRLCYFRLNRAKSSSLTFGTFNKQTSSAVIPSFSKTACPTAHFLWPAVMAAEYAQETSGVTISTAAAETRQKGEDDTRGDWPGVNVQLFLQGCKTPFIIPRAYH